jgi:cardiolipin synthase A/B
MSGALERVRAGVAKATGTEVPLWRRLAWPGALATLWAAWYATESLRHRREDRVGYEVADPAPPSSPAFRSAAEALTGHVAAEGNRAKLLINGDQIFPAILDAIEGAEESISLETYIYWRGEISRRLATAICERASAGVECRVLLDALGSAKMRPTLIAEMREAGAQVVRFRPPKPHLLGRVSNRTHRRIVVVDGSVGFTGGVGIASEWSGDAEDPDHWRDTHVRVEGPAVRALQGAFGEHWVEATGEALVGTRLLREVEGFEDGAPVQVVRSGSKVGDTNVEILYFLAIASAEESIDLTAAYFVPRPPFVDALCNAADRGVSVRILVPGRHIDKSLVRVAGRHVYERLLACGVEIHEYEPTMLHAKSMVIDGCWASVGTVNFDNRSFQLHEELTMCVFGGSLPAELQTAFEHDLTRSERIDPDRWRDRGWLQRAVEWATVPFRREL